MSRPMLKLAMLVAAASASSAIAAPLVQTVVFAKGDAGYDTFRIPAIITAANGSLLAFAEGRKNSASDTGDIDMVLRRSTDGGATWGPIQVIGNNGADVFGNPAPVLDTRTGRLMLLSTHNPADDASVRTVWSQQSDDNGATWTTAKEITSSVRATNATWFATGPGHAIQLTRGPHAGRLLVASDENTSSSSGALSIYSDDGGATWQRGTKVLSGGSTNLNESTEVELVDGRVQINARNSAGSTRSRTVAYSSDSGLTFGAKSQATALIDPIVQASILRFSAVDKGDAKNRILFSNPADASQRINMTVRSSFDETATWNAGKLIYRGPSAYSDLVAFGNKRAGVLFENGATSPYEKITFSAWSDGWLDDRTITQLDFNEKPSGPAALTTGALLDARGYGLNGTAIGAPTYVPGDLRWGSGSALHFTAGADAVRIPDSGFSSPLDVFYNDSFTLDCVFRTTDHGTPGIDNSGPLINKDGGTLPGYGLRIEGGKVLFSVAGSTGAVSLSSAASVNDGDWHSVTAIRDVALDQIRLYVDFKLVATAADTTTGGFANNSALLIGAMNSDAAAQFVGDIDFVRLSSGAINPNEFATAIPEPASLAAGLGIVLMMVRRPRRNFSLSRHAGRGPG